MEFETERTSQDTQNPPELSMALKFRSRNEWRSTWRLGIGVGRAVLSVPKDLAIAIRYLTTP